MSVVDINDFDIRCLTFNKINPDYQAKLDKEGKGIRNQYSIYPKYEGKQLSLCLTINSLEGGQTSNKDKTGKDSFKCNTRWHYLRRKSKNIRQR